jgi:hypothetical protein
VRRTRCRLLEPPSLCSARVADEIDRSSLSGCR